MSDTSVQEMKPGWNGRVEYLNISVLMCAKQSVCLQGRLWNFIHSIPFNSAEGMCVSRSSWPMAVRKLLNTRASATPPTIHTYAHALLAICLPFSSPTRSSSPQTCIVSDSLMWNCFSFKFPPGNAGRRKMLHLIMACYCCSFIRVLGFWVFLLRAEVTLGYFSLCCCRFTSLCHLGFYTELFVCSAHGNPAEKFITTSLYDYAMH